MAVGPPGRCDHIRHVGAVQQAGRCQGELTVTFIDIVHHMVQLMEARFLGEQVDLSLFGARVERGHLYLKHTFTLPVLVDDLFAQFDQWSAVTGRESCF